MANSRGKPQAETNTVCCQYLVWLGRNSVEKRLIRPRGVRKPTGPREKVLGRPWTKSTDSRALKKVCLAVGYMELCQRESLERKEGSNEGPRWGCYGAGLGCSWDKAKFRRTEAGNKSPTGGRGPDGLMSAWTWLNSLAYLSGPPGSSLQSHCQPNRRQNPSNFDPGCGAVNPTSQHSLQQR